MTIKCGEIDRIDKFKYVGEVIYQNDSDIGAIRLSVNKTNTAYHLTKNICDLNQYPLMLSFDIRQR